MPASRMQTSELWVPFSLRHHHGLLENQCEASAASTLTTLMHKGVKEEASQSADWFSASSTRFVVFSLPPSCSNIDHLSGFLCHSKTLSLQQLAHRRGGETWMGRGEDTKERYTKTVLPVQACSMNPKILFCCAQSVSDESAGYLSFPC